MQFERRMLVFLRNIEQFLISRLVHFKNTYGVLWTSVKIVLCQPLKKKPGQTSMASQLYIVHTSKFHGISHRIIWFGLGTSTTAIVGRAFALEKKLNLLDKGGQHNKHHRGALSTTPKGKNATMHCQILMKTICCDAEVEISSPT